MNQEETVKKATEQILSGREPEEVIRSVWLVAYSIGQVDLANSNIELYEQYFGVAQEAKK